MLPWCYRDATARLLPWCYCYCAERVLSLKPAGTAARSIALTRWIRLKRSGLGRRPELQPEAR
eukprot:4454732-Pyramimonas_sp.AAC.1